MDDVNSSSPLLHQSPPLARRRPPLPVPSEREGKIKEARGARVRHTRRVGKDPQSSLAAAGVAGCCCSCWLVVPLS